MRSSIIITPLTLLMFCGFALAQDGGRPEAVDQALKQRYGKDTRVEIVGTPTDINGVKVFNVRIRDDRGQSTAMVTEHGDFLLSGRPGEFKSVPEAVKATTGLFKSEPRDAQQFIADGYYIDLKRGDQTYRVRYDALGRLREITTPTEVERYETTTFKEAPEDAAGKVQELAEKHVPEGSEIKDVYLDPRYQGFYVAKYVGPEGKEVLVILDDQGNIYQTRTEIGRDDLPKPIMDQFGRMFDPNNIQYAYRTQYQYYQFQQPGPQGEMITFKVRPTGTIMDVQTPQADQEDQAVTAKFQQEGRTGDPQPQRERDRDRD